ncbi:MAG: 16S rRNA (cytidine(1402)-2'-O)-methyltransferase [Myxococcota bacterium]|nr:16S rRNA (cytidine(1402)-2'-O)-methyltransferase [Myxococcota bacterium]
MGTLHVVATPIGNLEDVTLRALRVIGEADLLFAEDTRRTRKLLDRHRIEARPLSLHAHNEQSRVDRALKALAGDGRVALVSDAGTPLVSDPGERLVAAAIAAGHRVEAVPGASAILAALTVAGLPAEPFTFLGFLPRRAGERKQVLDTYRSRVETLVLFESPKRIEKTLAELVEALGDRQACVARELTKMHEETRRGLLSELVGHFTGGVPGEITVVVAGATELPSEMGEGELDAEIRERIQAGQRPKEIAAALAGPSGRAKRDLYARVLALRAEGA